MLAGQHSALLCSAQEKYHVLYRFIAAVTIQSDMTNFLIEDFIDRKPIERSKKKIYHVMARSNNKEYFYLSQIEVWEIFTDQLKTLQEKYLIEISQSS